MIVLLPIGQQKSSETSARKKQLKVGVFALGWVSVNETTTMTANGTGEKPPRFSYAAWKLSENYQVLLGKIATELAMVMDIVAFYFTVIC